MLSDRWVIETLNYFIEEAGDNETLGHWDGNAAGAQIKEFVFIDLAGRCAVGATDIIGEYLKPGH